MPDFNHSDLVKFLDRPRYLREIAGYFDVPARVVSHQLQQAVESGDVLVYKEQIKKRFVGARVRQTRRMSPLYISSKSPLLSGDHALTLSLPKTKRSVTKESSKPDSIGSISSSRKPISMQNFMTSLKSGKVNLSGALNSISNKMRLARTKRSMVSQNNEEGQTLSEQRSLSYVEKISLFRGLRKESLPFLDIRKRFGVSRQVVKGLVRRGILAEVWGPNEVGVKYRLTAKGEANLKKLETASNFEREQRRKIFINLKQRVSA